MLSFHCCFCYPKCKHLNVHTVFWLSGSHESHLCHGRLSYLSPWVCWRIISFRLTCGSPSKTSTRSAERAKIKDHVCVFGWFRNDLVCVAIWSLCPLCTCLNMYENQGEYLRTMPRLASYSSTVCVWVCFCVWLRGTLKPNEALSSFRWRQEGWRLLEWTYSGPQKHNLTTPTALTYIRAHIHSLDFGTWRSNTGSSSVVRLSAFVYEQR